MHDFGDFFHNKTVLITGGAGAIGGRLARRLTDLGAVLLNPSQYVHGTDGYKRQSHEIRISSPSDQRLRFVAGLFYQKQDHEIFQRYRIDGLAAKISSTAEINRP